MGKMLFIFLLFILSINNNFAKETKLIPDPQLNPAFDRLYTEVSKCSEMIYKKPYTILIGEPISIAYQKITDNYTEAIKLFRLHCQKNK